MVSQLSSKIWLLAAGILIVVNSHLTCAGASELIPPPICGAIASPDPFFNLTVQGHKERLITAAEIARVVESPIPVEPTAGLEHAYDTTAYKTGFATLLARPQVQKRWPQTVQKLRDFLLNQDAEDEKVDEARTNTRHIISPHIVDAFGAGLAELAVTVDDQGQTLVAYYTADGKVRAHALGSKSILFESKPLDKFGPQLGALGWHKNAAGKLRLFSAALIALDEGEEEIRMQSWDWATKNPEYTQIMRHSRNGKCKPIRWISVPGERLILEANCNWTNMFFEVSDDLTHTWNQSLKGPGLALIDHDPWKTVFPVKAGLNFTITQMTEKPFVNLLYMIHRRTNDSASVLHTHDGKTLILYQDGFEKWHFGHAEISDKASELEVASPAGSGPGEIYETHDGRVLVAIRHIIQSMKGHYTLDVSVFEPLVSTKPIFTRKLSDGDFPSTLTWLTDIYSQTLLAVTHEDGTVHAFNPLANTDEGKFRTAPQAKATWFHNNGHIYFWQKVGERIHITELYSD